MNARHILIVGGCALAFGASFANTGIVLHTGTSVSHLTGDIAKLTINIAEWSPATLLEVYRVATAATLFFFGAATSGFLIHHPTLNLSRPYGYTITAIGVIFLLASLQMSEHPIMSIGLAAFGCGLQNALATHYRGIVLRTTHLTGMFTDFGTAFGMKVRGHDIPLWKIGVPFVLILSFFLGGLSAVATQSAGFDAITIAGFAYILSGSGWSIWKHGDFVSHQMEKSNKAVDSKANCVMPPAEQEPRHDQS